MIDTWLFTALVMGILTLCVILRGIRTASGDDRFVAGTVTVILVSMAALTLSIAWAAFIITDVVIFLDICYLGVMIWAAKNPGADRS
ncbi:MAG: hypothetical protein WC379_14675 [Methanoregula sp.]|jgi:multisubunit Na+/H+ antiporter MnhF subunit